MIRRPPRSTLFPSRRSSDLDLQHGGGEAEGMNAEVGTRNAEQDRKSTRLNSSHVEISYAVFCLKKKKNGKPVPSSPLTTCTLLIIDLHFSLYCVPLLRPFFL